MSWTCHNCENTVPDSSLVCDVCGAYYPHVDIKVDNQHGAQGSSAKFSWNALNVKSSFAICGERTFYLTNISKLDVPIGDSCETIDLYFCGTGGYIKRSYDIGNNLPKLISVTINGKEEDYRHVLYGETVTIEWKSVNGKVVATGTGAFDAHVRYSSSGSVTRLINAPSTLTLTVYDDKYETVYGMRTISIQCSAPKKPTLKNIEVVPRYPDTKKYVGEYVDLVYEYKDCEFVQYDYRSYPPKGTISVRLTSKTTEVKLLAYPKSIGRVDAIHDGLVTKSFFRISAETRNPEVIEFSTSDTFKKPGDAFLMSWKSKDVDHVDVWVGDTPEHGEYYKKGLPSSVDVVSIDGIKEDSIVKVYFVSRGAVPKTVTEVVKVDVTHFPSLKKMFHSDKS